MTARLIHHLLQQAGTEWSDAVAVSDRYGEWTYGELWRHSSRFARCLADAGCGRHHRVVFKAASNRHTVAMLYGCSIAGATGVPVSPRAKPFQIRQIVADAEPSLVISDGDGPGWINPDQIWQRALSVPPLREATGDPDDVAFLIYTSGSTSTPKGIVAPHNAVLFAATAIQSMLAYTDTDVVFCRVPLSFDYGLYQLLLAAIAGAEVRLDDGARDTTLITEIARSGSTVMPLLPSLARMLVGLAARRSSPTRIRLFTNTGETLPASTIALLRRHFPTARIQLMYGTSECKRVTILEPDGDLWRPTSVGRPLPGTTVSIVDENGRELPPGEVGEIVVSGRHVMRGYWRTSESDKEVFRDGRLHTGDYGRRDEDGYLFFEGRRDNIYKQNGIRTSTSEVEAAALDVDGVAEAVVLAPTARRAAVLCVVGALDGPEVLRQLATRLELGKVPHACVGFDTFPLGPNGKVERTALAARIDGGAQ